MKREHIVVLLIAVAILLLLARSCESDAPPAVDTPDETPSAEPESQPDPVPGEVDPAGDDDSADDDDSAATPVDEAPTARARRLRDGESLTGASAIGQAGDVLLTSGKGVRFVITDLDHRVGVHQTGGNLVDIALADGDDHFDGMATWFERTFPRQAAYREIQVDDGQVTVTGVDGGDDHIAVQTTWKLLPEQDDGVLARLEISTTVTNHGDAPIADYDLGDIVGWGGLRHFAPGLGWEPAGQDATVPWVGGQATGYAVLLVGDEPMSGPHGSSWTDPVYRVGALLPTVPVTYSRQLLVGFSLADLVPAALQQLGVEATEVLVEVQCRGEGVAGIAVEAVEVADDGAEIPALVGVTDVDGSFKTLLPPGRYRFLAKSPARKLLSAHHGLVRPGQPAHFVTTVSPEGRIHVRVTDPDGRDIPARITVVGAGRVPTPSLGPTSRAIGGNRAHITGPTGLPVPPGAYVVTASRGPAWSIESREVHVPELGPGVEVPDFTVALKQLVPTVGWRQCDLHQHAAWSYDSAVPPVDGIIASAAEGLDCIATTDHDAVADWTADLAHAGQTDSILWLPGIEVSSEQTAGHYNAYPWPPELGTVEHVGLDPAGVVAAIRARAPDALVQLNHPMPERIGMFSNVGIDPRTGLLIDRDEDGAPTGATWDWDIIEILNGKNVADGELALLAWLRMYDGGRSMATLVGNSDSHRLVGQERGVARTWIHVGAQAGVDGVVQGLKTGERVTATTGPFLDLVPAGAVALEEAPIRVTLMAPEWMPVDEIELLGGDPVGNGSWSLGTWRPGTPGLTETVVDGLRTWVLEYRVPLGGTEGWIIATARGREPMEPWMDTTAFAVTNPLRLAAP
jgi:hypothetical protein